jgi:molybdenum cofactor biosynthesis enzyme MoaA
MPECGIDFVKRNQLLSYEEMLRLVKVMSSLGVKKIRLTGGEPFVRKGLMDFISRVNDIEGIESIHITTNGTTTAGLVKDFKSVGISSVNLSLDTLDTDRFKAITHRDELSNVMQTYNQLLSEGIPTKINMVVMAGINEVDLEPMARLAQYDNVEVRFLEEMPFNGRGEVRKEALLYTDIQSRLATFIPGLISQGYQPTKTTLDLEAPGWKGNLGIIPAFSRTFCGSCNRLRLTPQGEMKTCLYSSDNLNLRDVMREGASDLELAAAIQLAVSKKAIDGHAAEQSRGSIIGESMATIGG